MRRILMFLIAGIVVGSVTGCGEKKNTDHIIARKVVAKAPLGPIRMQDYIQSKGDVKWLGTSYRCEIVRTADDSLAMVKDETGQRFVDNRISLEILRADGSVFFKNHSSRRTLTLASMMTIVLRVFLKGWCLTRSTDSRLFLQRVSVILRQMSIFRCWCVCRGRAISA